MTAIIDRNLWTAFGRVVDAPILFRAGASLVLAALAAGSAALAPMFLSQLVDGLADARGGAGAVGLAWTFLITLCFSRLAGHLQAHQYAIGDQALQRRVSQMTFDRLLRLPMSFHLSANPGALMQMQSQALQGVRMILALACATLFPIVVQMIVVLWVVGSVFTPVIWLLVSATIIAYLSVFTWGVRRSIKPTMLALQSQVTCSGRFSEGLVNVETIKNCTAEQRFDSGYAQAVLKVEGAWRSFSDRRLETGIATAVVFAASMGFSTVLGLEGVRAGRMSAGDFLLLITYMLQIVSPLEMSGYAMRDLTQGASQLSGLRDILALQPEPISTVSPPASQANARKAPRIEFKQVTLSYETTRRVLSGVSFSVPAGAMVAVVGATGEGKTSLLRILQKHVSPEEGRILVDDVPLTELDTGCLRRRIAVVSQEVTLFNASLRFNLIVGKPDANDADIRRVLRVTRLEALVDRLDEGLETVVGDRGFKLSGGERQRVAIARALLRDADILLLDEATSALDTRTERDICADLTVMAGERTTLVVTHRLPLAAAAGSLVVLQNGQVVEQGSHRELMAARGPYFELWTRQTDGEA